MEILTVIFILGISFPLQMISSESQCVKSETIVNGTRIDCSGQLLFSDEFNGSTLNASQWNTTSNYYLQDGKLHLPVEASTPFAVLSKFNFLYGRVDIRARIALGTARKVDFGFGFGVNFPDSKIYFGNVTDSNKGSEWYQLNWVLHYEFHTYTLIWHTTKFEYKCDGIRIFKILRPPSESNNERKISFEISNKFSGLFLNTELIVDYIRVHSIDKDDLISPCESTITEVFSKSLNKPTICKGDAIFVEHFNNFDGRKWIHEVQGPRTKRDEEFVLSDGNVVMQKRLGTIRPILWTAYRPDLDILRSSLSLSDRCTSSHGNEECFMQGIGQFIMPPIVAPRITTRHSFSFKYGRIEINAKLPQGDWIVPLLLLEPREETNRTTGYKESGQIRIAMVRGNENLQTPDGKNIGGQTVFGGVVLSNDAKLRTHFMVNRTLSDRFFEYYHHYSMVWSPNRMEFFVDGYSYGVIERESLIKKSSWELFDNFFYITLGISVGGFGDFVDDVQLDFYDKPWKNYDPKARLQFWQAKDKWYPSWIQPELKLHYIKVTAI